MPLDQQIVVTGQAVTPLDYTVPNASEIALLVVQATFDGTAASGAFVPAVEIRSDGRVLVARAITDQALAAGSAASVTFGPGLNAGEGVSFAFSSVAVAASGAGDTQLVAAVNGHRIRVVQAGLMAAGSVNVKFKDTGDLTGAYPLAANTGFVLGPVTDPARYWCQTAVSAALNINLSAGVNVGGVVGYVVV